MYIDDTWTAKYPEHFKRGVDFEDIAGEYKYPKSEGWGHTSDIADNFKAVDFYNNFTVVGDDIYAETAVSMKTTTVTDVNVWLNSTAVKKNIDELTDNIGSIGIEWKGMTIFYEKIEVHIYMQAENITPSLKKQWLERLRLKSNIITFKILEL